MKKMNRTIAAVVAIVIVVVLAAIWYFSTLSSPVNAPAPVPQTQAATTTATTTPVTPHIQSAASTRTNPPQPQVVLGGQTIDVDLAQTPAQQAQGLSGRTSLGAHEGMLFIFQVDGYEAFWMKDMNFSIDMLWLSDDGTVVYIQPNVSPSTYPEAFVPTQPARYVIELPANFAATYGIKVGDKAILP